MKRRSCVFTLIELLVVVAIIGVLMSLLLPSLRQARESARSAVCKSNMKQINTALNMYSGSYNQTIVPGGLKFSMMPAEYNYPGGSHADKAGYYTDPPLLGQFAGNSMGEGNVWNYIQGRQPNADSVFTCPSATDEITFGQPPYNPRIGINLRVTSFVRDNDDWDNLKKMSEILNPVKLAMFVDHKEARFHPGYGNSPPTHGNPQPLSDGGNWSFGVELSYYNWVKRHKKGGTNIGFIDGHVEYSFNLQSDVSTDKTLVVNK